MGDVELIGVLKEILPGTVFSLSLFMMRKLYSDAHNSSSMRM